MRSAFFGSEFARYAVAALLLAVPAIAQVRVWQDVLPLRTTVEGAPDPNPPFDIFATTKFNYPYTLRDNLLGEEKEIAWRALFLENEYLKCSVLPDIGGHLYTCVDKISGQPMFYANPTIKKAQIGYRGAWAAFGIEFNFPVSHNWVSMSPVPFSTATHPDGSASITVGNVDRPYGMQWSVELTLRPGSTLLEQRVTLYNRSDVRHRFYWWNNAGVRVWDDSRIFYPMRWTASHGFTEVDTWPVDSSGIDLSVIKNQVKGPVSLFVHGSREPFMGVYHPHTDTGVAHYADYAELPAKKIWSWGVDADGLDWRRALSDDNSAYVEVQAGLMRNQETYAFLQPQRTIRFTEYWMPVRRIGGISRANLVGVLNLERKNGRVTAGFNSNTTIAGAQARLLEGARVLHEEHVDLNPTRTWSFDLAAPAGKVTFVLTDSGGRVLMRQTEGEQDWSRESEIHTGQQQRVTPADALEAGADQELNGKLLTAYETYTNALGRTPDNQALRIAAGRLAVALLRDRDAVRWLAPAQARATSDPEIAYYLGLASGAREPLEAARRMPEFFGAASVQLAEMSSHNADREHALKYLREALTADPHNQRAADDLRMLEQPVAIPQTSDAERVLTSAAEHMRLGLWQAALEVLSHNYPEAPAEQREPGVPEPKNHPMVAYYRAYCREKLGQSANVDYTTAASLPARYVFPNGAQSLAVLEHTVTLHSADATAHYLLGNMRLQSGLVEDAINEWRTAQRLNGAIPVLNASLGRVLLRLKHDPQGALESFRAGLTPDPLNPELYAGFATAAAIMVRPATERVSAMERYPDSSHMPTSLVYDLALAYAEAGMFDKARHMFENRFFPREEGGTNVRQVWIRVRALEASSDAGHGKCADALGTLDRLRQPVAGLSFTNDGLEPFIDAAPNQTLFGTVESACGRSDAAAKRLSELSRRRDLATLVFAHKLASKTGATDGGEWSRRLEQTAVRQNPGSSWQATVDGLAELELGHTERGAELLRSALLFPDRNLAHHIARSELAGIKQ